MEQVEGDHDKGVLFSCLIQRSRRKKTEDGAAGGSVLERDVLGRDVFYLLLLAGKKCGRLVRDE